MQFVMDKQVNADGRYSFIEVYQAGVNTFWSVVSNYCDVTNTYESRTHYNSKAAALAVWSEFTVA